MTNAGNRFPLLGGGGGKKGTGGTEQDIVPPTFSHPIEQKTGKNSSRTAATGTTTMNILLLQIKNQSTAIIIVGKKSWTISLPSFPKSPVTIRS